MMPDAEFDRLGRRHRMTAEEERAWFAELNSRKAFERMGWPHEKIRRRGHNLHETQGPREPQSYTITGRSGRRAGHMPD